MIWQKEWSDAVHHIEQQTQVVEEQKVIRDDNVDHTHVKQHVKCQKVPQRSRWMTITWTSVTNHSLKGLPVTMN